ncbi:hypothetical protein NKI01_20530 [Mesorhizobium sp. M0815]|uniref:hypothetical protein n=1 Tax=Mesorhizobium sp. M0815 TaxID=2957005 RepID=UPI00333DF9FF
MKKPVGSRGISIGPGSSGNRFIGIQISGFEVGVEDNGVGNSFNNLVISDTDTAVVANGRDATFRNLVATSSFESAMGRADRKALADALHAKLSPVDADLAVHVFDDLKAGAGITEAIKKIEINPLYRTANIGLALTTLAQFVISLFG